MLNDTALGGVRSKRAHVRKIHPEGGADADHAVEPDCPAHKIDKLLGNGEAKAGTAIAAREGFVGLDECAKDCMVPLIRDTDSGVGYFNANKFISKRFGA